MKKCFLYEEAKMNERNPNAKLLLSYCPTPAESAAVPGGRSGFVGYRISRVYLSMHAVSRAPPRYVLASMPFIASPLRFSAAANNAGAPIVHIAGSQASCDPRA